MLLKVLCPVRDHVVGFRRLRRPSWARIDIIEFSVEVREAFIFLSACLEMLNLRHFSMVIGLRRLVSERERILDSTCKLGDTEVSDPEHEVSLVFESRNMPLWGRRAIKITPPCGTFTINTV